MATTTAPRRDWMKVGARYHEPHRTAVERQIAGLNWRTDTSAAMTPALAINACIEELQLPRVSAYATNGYLRVQDGPETAHYSIYGIEANYRNGRARLYVLDTGTEILPLASDFWPSSQRQQ